MARTPNRDTLEKFTVERLEAFARDLKSQRIPLERQTLSDDMVTGMRATVHKSGLITYSVSYTVGDKRPFMKLGDANKDSPDYISLEDARAIAKTVKALGDKGIDVQDGLHKRLIRELKRDGTAWKLK
jgi:hypothetical protein